MNSSIEHRTHQLFEKINKLKNNINNSLLYSDELELLNEKLDDINNLFDDSIEFESAIDNIKYRNKLLQLIAPVIIYYSLNYPDYESLNENQSPNYENQTPNYENQTPNEVGG